MLRSDVELYVWCACQAYNPRPNTPQMLPESARRLSTNILVFRKKSFFRAVNAIIGKVLRNATEDTVLHLTDAKCMPILL